MSHLIIPVTVMLLRGALSVLLLAGAEAIFADKLSARVRRVLWIICIFSMMLPQPEFAFQPFAIDLSEFQTQVIDAADAHPWEFTDWLHQMPLAPFFSRWAGCIPGLSHHNYPYFLMFILMTVPAVFILIFFLFTESETHRRL